MVTLEQNTGKTAAMLPTSSSAQFPSLTPRDSGFQNLINRNLPELATLERLLKNLHGQARVNVEAVVRHEGNELPVHSIVFGTEDRSKPTLAVFGGVHGLERIGTHVVLAFLQTVSELMSWDKLFQQRMEKSRLVFMPIVNPAGMFLTRRSNGNGVDLMRNSPTTADEKPKFLISGHRYSNALPFYRGLATDFNSMELESKALCNLVMREVLPANLSLSLDLHSGFGSVDRLWFPYAKTTKPPPRLLEMVALKRVFDRSYPNHFYRIEPQAAQYTTHGDLWDWLFDKQLEEAPEKIFLPWTLELGSWIWLKKNPRQIFSSLGAFNPLQPHRLQRILRRHLTLFDFFHRAILSAEPWTILEGNDQAQLLRRAKDLWYEKSG